MGKDEETSLVLQELRYRPLKTDWPAPESHAISTNKLNAKLAMTLKMVYSIF
jgi:hypothetical protein